MQDRALHPLAALANYSQQFQNMTPEEQGMQMVGVGSVGKQGFEELMKAAEQAMVQKQLQKQPMKLMDLMAVGGALPAGMAGGYYGMGQIGGENDNTTRY
jgi:hypothetical protein